MKLSYVLNHFFDLKLLSLLVHSIRLVLSIIMVHSLMVILSLDGVHFIPCGTISFRDSLSDLGNCHVLRITLALRYYLEVWFT